MTVVSTGQLAQKLPGLMQAMDAQVVYGREAISPIPVLKCQAPQFGFPVPPSGILARPRSRNSASQSKPVILTLESTKGLRAQVPWSKNTFLKQRLPMKHSMADVDFEHSDRGSPDR